MEEPHINILQLPEEVLEIIVAYADIKSRRKLASVCKYFYELLCRLERDQHPLELAYSQVFY